MSAAAFRYAPSGLGGAPSLHAGEHRGSGLRRSGTRMGRVFAGVQRQDRQLVLWSGTSSRSSLPVPGRRHPHTAAFADG